MKRFLLTVLFAFTLPLLLPAPAHGLKVFLERARKLYELDKPVGTCLLCHTYDEKKDEEPDKKNLNDYGHDVANDARIPPIMHVEENHRFGAKEHAVIDAVLRSLEHEDSDKDGATNAEEMALNTQPGVKSSVPTPEALQKFRAKK